ncbi:hypothetical protein GG804_18500 [Sphingomonas histidinilytica]|uniref:TorF family putative porin n=1 Tax=Rhizorhabdus histidinilytica TaxID=439228 RepID=UPI001ADA7F49|nr:TorF family putative porin [Rhizorhabdus histidinilytica]MBO9378764.1 hypothetical protein [Rhizorhabdus histidinilytica]
MAKPPARQVIWGLRILLFLPACASACDPALARDSPSIVTELAIVSDYRFRGISASERGPAIQANVEMASGDGLVVGVWASSIADYHGSNIELDFYSGFRSSIGETQITILAYGFVYPGGDRVNTYDIEASLTRMVGAATFDTLIALAPRQRNAPRTNVYLSETVTLPLAPNRLALRLHYGWEEGMYDDKQDWSVGLRYTKGKLEASLSYVDSDYQRHAGRNAAGSLVGAMKVRF